MYKNENSLIDQAEVENFLDKVVADTSGLAVTILAALADRLGLFKTMAANGPVTSAELADLASIHPRYAKEWASAMFSAGYLDYDPASETFTLPAAHIPVLAEEGGPYFVGGTHQMLLGMLDIVDLLQQAFVTGHGIPMSAYGANTWEGMERDMTGVYQANLFQRWIPAMSGVQSMLKRGIDVADIGCGSGQILIMLAKEFPNSRYVGYDLFEPLVARARANAAAAGVLDNVRFEVLDGNSGVPGQFDLIITFDVIHDAADPSGLLQSIRRSLRPDGRYICMDVNCSDKLEENTGNLAALRYGFSILYCMSTSLADDGVGLGTMGLSETKMRQLCQVAGFGDVQRLPLDGVHNVYEVMPKVQDGRT